MSNHVNQYEEVIDKFVNWAEKQGDIRVIMVVGSQARKNEPADEWSDLDLVIFTRNPEAYLTSAEWVYQFGPVWVTFVERTAVGGGKERRVLYEGALDVDFSFFHVEDLSKLFTLPDTQMVVARGMQVLLDKDHLLKDAVSLIQQPSPSIVNQLPSQEEFNEVVSDFWYHSVWGTKKLMRGEIWIAKGCIDNYLKQLLLTMVKWHAHSKNDLNVDTWHEGRFFEKWADISVQNALQNCYASYDSTELAEALNHTMELFRSLQLETARWFGFRSVENGHMEAAEWIKRTMSEREFLS